MSMENPVAHRQSSGSLHLCASLPMSMGTCPGELCTMLLYRRCDLQSQKTVPRPRLGSALCGLKECSDTRCCQDSTTTIGWQRARRMMKVFPLQMGVLTYRQDHGISLRIRILGLSQLVTHESRALKQICHPTMLPSETLNASWRRQQAAGEHAGALREMATVQC